MKSAKEIISILFTTLGIGLALYYFYEVITGFPPEHFDLHLAGFAFVTIFLSSLLQIQLPRRKVYVSFSDAMLFAAILLYGGKIAVVLAVCESLFASLMVHFRRNQVKPRSIFLNVAVAAVGTALTALAAEAVSGFLNHDSVSGLTTTISAMTLVQFLAGCVAFSFVNSMRSDENFSESLKSFCGQCLIIYVANGIFAGVFVFAVSRIDFVLMLFTFPVAAILLLSYRYLNRDMNETVASAELAERERAEAERLRAEQAERHIAELERHIAEQERIRQALSDSKDKFRHAAFHDSLTDLPNRNYFSQEIKYTLEKCKVTPDFRFAVLFLDINRFKTINDSLGHSNGDKLIMAVAKRLRSIVRDGDMISRFNGNEFAILLNNINDVEEVKRYAEIIKRKTSLPFTINGRQIFTSVSVGITVGSDKYEDPNDILRDAGIAMYSAKKDGQDSKIFDSSMHRQTVSLLQLETDLRYAIVREEFCVYYQPIIDLKTMNLIGFEALMRWNHPTKGLVPPYEFIPLSEETGLIVPMTIWILKTACAQVKKWQGLSPQNSNLIISINISGKHFSQGDLVKQVIEMLKETDFNPRHLKLEITESAVMDNAERAVSVLNELKEIGINLSIDDFGTGYSSLSYLHRFPIDTLKVDRSFVNGMTDATENGKIAHTIITLAHSLGMQVVAEGIETIHQLHQLRVLDCEFGQGYLFARPLPNDEIEKLLLDLSVWKSFVSSQNPAVTQYIPEHGQIAAYQ